MFRQSTGYVLHNFHLIISHEYQRLTRELTFIATTEKTIERAALSCSIRLSKHYTQSLNTKCGQTPKVFQFMVDQKVEDFERAGHYLQKWLPYWKFIGVATDGIYGKTLKLAEHQPFTLLVAFHEDATIGHTNFINEKEVNLEYPPIYDNQFTWIFSGNNVASENLIRLISPKMAFQSCIGLIGSSTPFTSSSGKISVLFDNDHVHSSGLVYSSIGDLSSQEKMPIIESNLIEFGETHVISK